MTGYLVTSRTSEAYWATASGVWVPDESVPDHRVIYTAKPLEYRDDPYRGLSVWAYTASEAVAGLKKRVKDQRRLQKSKRKRKRKT